jgi:hypothetical protein
VAAGFGAVALGFGVGAVTVTVGAGAALGGLCELHAARLIPAANAMAGIPISFLFMVLPRYRKASFRSLVNRRLRRVHPDAQSRITRESRVNVT